MKKIIFKALSIKNFLSIGSEKLEINFLEGINLITGENLDNLTRNGVGKSSLIEAIFWCLFGNTIRDIKNDKLIHNFSKKDCEVSLNFSLHDTSNQTHEYTICRFLGPSKIQIICDGVDITLSTIPANDEFIKKALGATEELFHNAVIMTANSTVPFMAQKKIDKRKFLESVFNLNVFSDMLLKTRSDFNQHKKENDLLCNSLVNENKNLEIFEKQANLFEDQKQIKIKQWEDLILKANDEIEKLSSTINDVKQLDSVLQNLKDKQSKLKNGLEKIEDLISESKQKSFQYQHSINHLLAENEKIADIQDKCHVCLRPYTEDHRNLSEKQKSETLKRINNLQTEKKEIDKLIQEKQKQKREIISALEQISDKIQKNLETKQNELAKNEKIKDIQIKIKEYQTFISNTKNETNSFDKEIKNVEKNIKSLEDKILNAKKQLLTLENVKFVLSEEGVKTFIVNKLLDILNNKLNFYLNQLNAPCSCEFNDQFEETLINLNGQECSYFNFSGGERKRIDLAILFMFQDILRISSGTFFSLSIYDELFDSAIDESGIEMVLKILKDRVDKNKESIYIISHNKNSIKNEFDNILNLQKKDGKTVLIS